MKNDTRTFKKQVGMLELNLKRITEKNDDIFRKKMEILEREIIIILMCF